MKTLNRVLASIVLMAVMIGISQSAFAASDYYLKIEGGKGKALIVPVTFTNGQFVTTENVSLSPSTECTFTILDASKKPLCASTQACANGLSMTCIVSPRDHASGLPTGKRMHKPFTVTKELDKSTPLLSRAIANSGQTLTCVCPVGDVDMDGPMDCSVSIKISGSGGKTMAMDDWTVSK